MSQAFVRWALRYGRLLWALALVLSLPALARTAWLYGHLRSELEELLPRDSPSVTALNELRDRVGAHQYLGVVVDSGTAGSLPAAERFLDDLAVRVRRYPPSLVSDVRTGDQAERSFLDQHGALYLDLEDLRSIQARIEARRDYEAEKETGALLDEDTPAPPVDFGDIQSRYEKRLGVDHERGAGGRYTSAEDHLTVLVVELGQYSTGTGTARRLIDRVKEDIAALGGLGHYAPGMRLGFAGDAAISVEELSALVSDLSVSSAVVVVAVLGAIVVYYRWWRSLWIVGPPLLVAAVCAFGIASLPPFGVTSLNSNTAFLGSIIIGNGINFGLILLARYVDERRAGGGGAHVARARRRGVAGRHARGGGSGGGLVWVARHHALPGLPAVRVHRRARDALRVGRGVPAHAVGHRLVRSRRIDSPEAAARAHALLVLGRGRRSARALGGDGGDHGADRGCGLPGGALSMEQRHRVELLPVAAAGHLEDRRGLLGQAHGLGARTVPDAPRSRRG